MKPGLTIKVVDPDPDYLGIEIQASSHRFSGSARIYAGLNDLSEFAACIESFPSNSEDRRNFEFGSPDPGYAGGFCTVSLYCVDRAGHARVEVKIEDDNRKERMESAMFGFPILAAGVDQFVFKLRQLERDQDGEAVLEMASLG
jgi:hypothetical protein